MDHLQFKANQTAAVYVADGLDEATQEAFELHMMGCPECVDDVEAWRAIKQELPAVAQPAARATPHNRRFPALTDWRMAASLLGAGVVGAAGGWFGRATQGTDLDSTVVFNVPSVSRGAECTPLPLTSDTRVALLRVPGLSRGLRLVALDSERRELPAGSYTTRVQPDGSQLLRIESRYLLGRAVHLEARGADGSAEPVGCVSGETTVTESAP
ncbi:MAG TPA: zf-HC2 domain-containing protein [Steroidobacteraceae bacterium]|nr:zf-HC2 domain-containing protein [Steroidobacteraceae bacterium]